VTSFAASTLTTRATDSPARLAVRANEAASGTLAWPFLGRGRGGRSEVDEFALVAAVATAKKRLNPIMAKSYWAFGPAGYCYLQMFGLYLFSEAHRLYAKQLQLPSKAHRLQTKARGEGLGRASESPLRSGEGPGPASASPVSSLHSPLQRKSNLPSSHPAAGAPG